MFETKGDRMKIWNALRTPPDTALKEIKGGRLSGMTDIRPQWRYQAMTEQFGPCGTGWKYTIDELWNVEGPGGEVFAFARVTVYYRVDDGWSEPTPGIGGSMIVAQESAGLHSSDEGFKMAVTDSLSVAMKMIGVGADIYMGQNDGSKHTKPSATVTPVKDAKKDMGDLEKRKDYRDRILNICMTIAGGDESQAPSLLEEFSTWEKNGKVIKGVRSGAELGKKSEDALRVILKSKAEPALKVWQSAHGDDGPGEFAEQDIPF